MKDLELKLKLAQELPELIGIRNPGESFRKAFPQHDIPAEFWWLDTGKEITEREWDWVVNQVVKKLPEYKDSNDSKNKTRYWNECA